ncbi:toxin [Ornithinimicrobium avium]|uniref:Toxin n=1 Tax=Ornithinimicrobium avium TaxID=2283195 RepID=A0A345NQT6_9MICO|nr:toxin [Ornithinimicrobium avium]AXH97394.1 toxin [Ornithinimicrobium avium]
MKVNPSALKHGLTEPDILHAAENWAYASEPDDDMPAKQFVLGFDRSGRLLEMAILNFDSGHQLVIHAMKARRQYLHLLE